MPLRDQPPLVNEVAGAIDIQTALNNMGWVYDSCTPATYAAHLRRQPLAGVPPKRILIQFPKGDRTAANPVTTAIIWAGALSDVATYCRHDLAVADHPNLARNPHSFIVGAPVGLLQSVADGAQHQIGAFLASDGMTIIHPEPVNYFEVPIEPPLPEDFNFVR